MFNKICLIYSHAEKNNLLCHKIFVSIFYETIISRACDFSNQEILSKMMLNAYSQAPRL